MTGLNGFRFGASVVMVTAALALPSQAWGQATDPIGAVIARAKAMEAAGQNDLAIKLLRTTLDENERRSGPDDPATTRVRSALGLALVVAREFEAAEPHLRQVLEVTRVHPEAAGALRLSALNGLAVVLMHTARPAEAVPLCEEVLRAVEATDGPDGKQTTGLRNALAQAYLEAKRPRDAIPVARRALQGTESRLTPDDPETINPRNTLAIALLRSADYPEAEKLLNASLAIARAKLKPDDPLLKVTLNGLAGLYQETNRRAEAQAIAGELGGGAVLPGTVKSNEAVLLGTKAQGERTAGNFVEAERLYREAIAATIKDRGKDHPQVGILLADLAGMFGLQSRLAEAEECAREALRIAEKNPGRGTLAEARACVSLGFVQLQASRPAEAMVTFERAYKTFLEQNEPGHPETISTLVNLMTIDWTMHNYPRAVERGQSALADLQKKLPGEHRFTAVILMNLGEALEGLRRHEEAEPYLLRAVAIMEKEPGRPTAEAAGAYNALASLYQLTGRSKEAEAAFRKVVSILVGWYGPDHPQTTGAIDNLGSVLASGGRWAEAADEFDRSRKARRRFLDRTLPRMAEDDQIRFVDDNERQTRDAALSMGLGRQTIPGLSARSAEWALNSKAVTLSALAERAILSRDVRKPEVAQLVAERDAVRSKLAMLTVSQGRTEGSSTPLAETIASLVDQERELSRRLGLAIGSRELVNGWVNLDDVRKALPADGVLVEFARVRVYDNAKVAGGLGWREPRYAAWVIPATGRGEVTLVDLGDAGEIETALAAVLRGLSTEVMGHAGAGIEKEAEDQIAGPLRILADRVIEPLRPHMGNARRWVLSPDAALWLVPWAALPDKAGRYAVEDNLIHLVVTGRDLLARAPDVRSDAPAILADPDYGLARGLAIARARELGRTRGDDASTTTSAARPRRDLLPDAVRRLEGTATEANAVAPFLQALTGVEPSVYLQASASETVFKSLRGPKVLILSTHGFFLDPPEPTDKGPAPPANPLLRCGLILAGYNSAAGGAETDDGVLSGLEVAASDLRGTDLVVLSACETGLGEVRIGEGVAGLRQVFQLAGAQAVVASLWSVRDDETSQLMATFFQSLSRHRGHAAALRDAQRALIADRRTRLGAAHPYYWAAFTLTGPPGEGWRDAPLDGDPPPIPKPGDFTFGPISPVTGRPAPGGARTDAALGVVLTVVGGSVAGWWWRRGSPTPG